MRARLRILVWTVGLTVKKGSGIGSSPSIIIMVMQILVTQNGHKLISCSCPLSVSGWWGLCSYLLIQRYRLVELLPLGTSSNTTAGGAGTVELDASDFKS